MKTLPLVWVHELVDNQFDSEDTARVFRRSENIARQIFFSSIAENSQHYIQRQPRIEPQIPHLAPEDRKIGAYETLLLDKITNPAKPVVCVVGFMGSGKSRTTEFLLDILRRKSCPQCVEAGLSHGCERLIGLVDFARDFSPFQDENEAAERLLKVLCQELKARVVNKVSPEEELFDFWDGLVQHYTNYSDNEVNEVVRRMIDEAPWLNQLNTRRASRVEREKLLKNLRDSDTRWYLKYLVLLWRYLLHARYHGHRDCAFVVLDNVDSLPTQLQRDLVDFVVRSACQDGPTFVVLLRPETMRRHGLADVFVDVVKHERLLPREIVIDRIDRFLAAPDDYLAASSPLADGEREMVLTYVNKARKEMDHNRAWLEYMESASGESIRLALELAQGFLLVSESFMKREAPSAHFFTRASMRMGCGRYTNRDNHGVHNLFHVGDGCLKGRMLSKLRILDYVYSHGTSVLLSQIRNTFVMFGYEPATVKSALNQMMNHNCQLLISDGWDVLRENWGDEDENIYITEIGTRYLTHMVRNTDYVQEVMLATQVELSDRWPRKVELRGVSDKLALMFLFCRELLHEDVYEVERMIALKGLSQYKDLFGDELITVSILHDLDNTVNRIAQSIVGSNPHFTSTYKNITEDFGSLINQAEARNKEIFGQYPTEHGNRPF